MSNDPTEWFRLLDLPLGAGRDEVKQSYRELAKVWHPDRFAHDPSLLRKAQEKMKQINHAYQQLTTRFTEHGPTVFTPSASNPPSPEWAADRRTAPPPYGAGPPPPPMAAMSKGGDGVVRLSWAPVYDLANFNVKRSDVRGGPYTTIATGVAWTEHTDRAVENGRRYYYVISSIDRARESANSPELTALPLATPAAPTDLTAAIRNGSVHLKWRQSPSPEIVWNILYRQNANGEFDQIAQIRAATRYQDKNCADSASTYAVAAMNCNAQQSARSNVAAARPK